MVSIRQRTIKHLKQMGATWGRFSLPVKVIGLITIATVIDVALRNTQLWSLIPWQLVFGLLIGVLIFSYNSYLEKYIKSMIIAEMSICFIRFLCPKVYTNYDYS